MLISMFFNSSCLVEKFVVSPHCIYRDSITLRVLVKASSKETESLFAWFKFRAKSTLNKFEVLVIPVIGFLSFQLNK